MLFILQGYRATGLQGYRVTGLQTPLCIHNFLSLYCNKGMQGGGGGDGSTFLINIIVL